MRRLGFSLALALALFAGPALAQTRATSAPPSFTRAERQVIARNAELSRRARANPQAVREALDVLARPPSTNRTMPPTEGRPPFNRRRNPDLDRLYRTSPEAALDLFRLLETAGRR
jgi:hypothetical protein